MQPNTRSNNSLPSQVTTYFYVFVDERSENRAPSRRRLSNSEEGDGDLPSDLPLDVVMHSSFDRFARNYKKDAVVSFNPERSNDIRRAFGIEQLPAFGISDVDLAEESHLATAPSKLPSKLNIFAWRERQRILKTGKFLPKVERSIVSRHPEVDGLYNFIRDLHLRNLDIGLVGVVDRIDQEVLALGGKKVLGAVATGKKIFLG